MKRNPHIIVQQVCPVKKIDNGKYEVQAAHAGYLAYPALNGHVLIVRMSIYCITSRHVIIAFVPRMPCMEKRPTMPGSRLENGKFHNKRT